MPAPRKVSLDDRDTIYDMARAGRSYAEIGRRYNITRERVRQIILELDPTFLHPRHCIPRKILAEPICEGTCIVCGETICLPRTKFCGPEHYQAMKAYKRIIDPVAHHRAVANWILETSDDPGKRTWAAKVLETGTTQKQWLLEGSRTYRLLEESGLLEKLPESVTIK